MASAQRRRIQRLWHLGRLDQLKSVFTSGGLFSRAIMDSAGIDYVSSSWGAEGKAEQFKDYICCSLVPPWGMSRNDPDQKVLIQLQPRLLWRKDTLFSPQWSSHNDVTLCKLISNSNAEVFDSMFDNRETAFPSPPPGEILMAHSIDCCYFLPYMLFHSEHAKARAIETVGNLSLTNGASIEETFTFSVHPYSFRGNR